MGVRARKRISTRRELVLAGRRLFSQEGIYESRIEDITKHAGIAKGTLYLHFRSKEDLVSMHLFEELLRDEEGHIDFLETQLDLLDKIGVQNYGQLQADPANEVEGEAE